MYNTFNMGIGMCIAVPADQAEKAMALLKSQGEDAYLVGEIIPGDGGVEVC